MLLPTFVAAAVHLLASMVHSVGMHGAKNGKSARFSICNEWKRCCFSGEQIAMQQNRNCLEQ